MKERILVVACIFLFVAAATACHPFAPTRGFKLISPDGGELLVIGSSTTVIWEGDIGLSQPFHLMAVKRDGAVITLAKGYVGQHSDKSWTWSPVEAAGPGEYKIRMRVGDTSDESDGFFRLVEN